MKNPGKAAGGSGDDFDGIPIPDNNISFGEDTEIVINEDGVTNGERIRTDLPR